MRVVDGAVTLTPRLEAVLSLVPPVGSCCDIGTDHGYLAIALAGRVKRVIAADINAAPLKVAERNIRLCGLTNIDVRRSDGFSAIAEGEAECAVMAGMGGDLIKRITAAGIKGAKYLVLQPQSLIYELRGYLAENGYITEDEVLCREDGRFYAAMRLRPGRERVALTEAERRVGPVLLRRRPPLFEEYIGDEIRKLKLALSKIDGGGKANVVEYNRLIRLYGGVLNG